MPAHQNRKASTLTDVAKDAGVSLATASRVLSNAGYPVSPSVRNKVRESAKKLHYMPNMLGKMLKSNTGHAIGVIVPTLQNPFFSQTIFGIEAAARQSDYEIMIFSSHRSFEQERNDIQSLLQSRIMSLIIISVDHEPQTLQRYVEYGGKVALLESDFPLEQAIRAETDHLAAGQIAAGYLTGCGHKNIAFLTAPLNKTYRRQILKGVKKELTAARVSFSDKDVFAADSEGESNTGLYEFEAGRQLAEDFLTGRKKYTAIIAINDITAFGIIQALHQHGVSVPEDVSVISFDNITYSEMISPPLTTVELPSNSMGFSVCHTLIYSMMSETTQPPDLSLKFPGRLIERDSVRRLNPS